MLVVRAVRESDLPGLMDLAAKTGTGLTTLPAHEPSLLEKIHASQEAFSAETFSEKKLTYLFVLEDTETGTIAGTSAIISGVGYDRPFYSYRLLHITQVSHEPEMRVDTELLQLSNDFVGATEVATLFLAPEYRRDNLGKLLSKARYMFMACHPERFSERVISEIRGWVRKDQSSPFWEAIGRHFFGVSFAEADEINGRGNSQFIADMMPKFPIYTALLPSSAQKVIGRPHDNAKPAIHMLESEGFRFSGAVDIFDAGPAMEVSRDNIRTVRTSSEATLGGTVDGAGHDFAHLACNQELAGFKAILTDAVDTASGLWIPKGSAELLDIQAGDAVRTAPLLADT
ncbi:arginine N-succinyltransferase [Kordiimonas sediminis]|uniref:Arginine N-succinyltransferase n=1 Tax=Kordiimonas sediminis TaxID=1735581 RepID=A0A919AQ17_9PROT|nr:arginine N-succinyltransferase [Kordiimonas sediminis]GHF18688.1 arginine N-succinyltransferase [Kordiimonas sediminis]